MVLIGDCATEALARWFTSRTSRMLACIRSKIVPGASDADVGGCGGELREEVDCESRGEDAMSRASAAECFDSLGAGEAATEASVKLVDAVSDVETMLVVELVGVSSCRGGWLVDWRGCCWSTLARAARRASSST